MVVDEAIARRREWAIVGWGVSRVRVRVRVRVVYLTGWLSDTYMVDG